MWCEMRLGQFLVGLKPQALGFIRRYDECIVKRENKSSRLTTIHHSQNLERMNNTNDYHLPRSNVVCSYVYY